MQHRREDRHVVQIAGAYRARHGRSRAIWIKDVSEYGCHFFDKFSILEIGKDVLVKIGNIGPLAAAVRWRDGYDVGVRFEAPLHPGVLDHITRFMSEDR